MAKPLTFEATFVVEVTPQEAWEALTRPAPEQVPGEPAKYLLAGFEAVCTELEVDPGRMLRVRKEDEPCRGSEILVVLQAEDPGVRVSVVQSGFPAAFRDAIESFFVVGKMLIADLALYLERGISTETHLFMRPPPRASLGVSTLDKPAGLKVLKVEDDGFGARAGLARGDMLVTLNGARLMSATQLSDLMRMAKPGDEVEAVWVRGRERMSALAAL